MAELRLEEQPLFGTGELVKITGLSTTFGFDLP